MDEPTASASLRSWRSLREELGSPDGPRRDTSTVPINVIVMLQTTLGGPHRRCGQVLGCVPAVWRVRAWCGCWFIGGVTAGYTSLIFKDGTFTPPPPHWATVGYSAAVLYTAVGVICAIATYEMAEIVGATVDDGNELAAAERHTLDAGLLPESSDRQSDQQEPWDDGAETSAVAPLRENPSRSFLRGLLQGDVSTTASQVLAQQVKRAKQASVLLAVVIALQAVINLTRPGRLELLDGTEDVHIGLLFSVVSFWIVFYPCIVILAGWLIFLRAPCVIICDRIKYSAARVRQMTSETADYDAIMGYIHEAHELTVRLEVLLSPTLIGTCLMCSVVALQWFFAACTVVFAESHNLVGWVDQTTGEPLVVHAPLLAWFAAGFVVVQGPVWQMFAAASTTTACEELVEAVAALRYSSPAPSRGATTARETDAGGDAALNLADRHKHVEIASPDNLIRIQGLLDFAKDVNRAAGLGVTLKYCRPFRTRRPITVSFLWRMAFAVGGGTLALSATVTTLIRHVRV